MGPFAHSKCADKVRVIQRFHIVTRGWADIAYNAVVCPHGSVFEGRGLHTTSAANGDTVPNDTHYAVCYLGGENDPFTDAGKQGFHDAVQWLRTEGDAGPEVNGHRDHKSTACPGDAIYAWLRSHNFNLEDDMFSEEDRKDLKELKEGLASLRELVVSIRGKERERDQRIAGRDKARDDAVLDAVKGDK
jgi:hypothetical protein